MTQLGAKMPTLGGCLLCARPAHPCPCDTTPYCCCAQVFQDVLAESNTVAEEVLSLSRVVRTFGTEKQEGQRYMGWLK